MIWIVLVYLYAGVIFGFMLAEYYNRTDKLTGGQQFFFLLVLVVGWGLLLPFLMWVRWLKKRIIHE